MGELLIGLTKCFAFHNGKRPYPALGNQTPDSVHTSSTGCRAIIVDKYGAKPESAGLPIALRCTATALGKVSNGECKNRCSAVQLCEIGSSLNYRQVCLEGGAHFEVATNS